MSKFMRISADADPELRYTSSDYNRQHLVNRRKSPAIAGDHAEAYRRVMSTWPSLMVGTAEGDLPKLFSQNKGDLSLIFIQRHRLNYFNHTHAHARKRTRARKVANTCTRARTCMHAHAYAQARAHAYAQARARVRGVHSRAYACACLLARACARARACGARVHVFACARVCD